jgi:hypothetical protein
MRNNLDVLLDDGKKPTAQYLGIEVTKESMTGEKANSHIYIVQH